MAAGIKTGGRVKGTPNKSTSMIRQELRQVLSKEIVNVGKYFKDIRDPEKKLIMLTKLLPFIMATVKEEEKQVEDDRHLSANEIIAKLINVRTP